MSWPSYIAALVFPGIPAVLTAYEMGQQSMKSTTQKIAEGMAQGIIESRPPQRHKSRRRERREQREYEQRVEVIRAEMEEKVAELRRVEGTKS